MNRAIVITLVILIAAIAYNFGFYKGEKVGRVSMYKQVYDAVSSNRVQFTPNGLIVLKIEADAVCGKCHTAEDLMRRGA